MTTRSSLPCLVAIAIAFAVPALAQLALQNVGTVATPLPVAWSAWGENTLAVTDLDARLITWSNSEATRSRTLFDLPAPPTLVDAWGDSILIQVSGEGGRLLDRGANDPAEWIEKPANWRLANTEILGEGYRVFVDPLVFLLVYSAPGPGSILGLLDIAQTIGQADVWAWDGDRAVLGNDDGVYVVNLGNPLVPVITGSVAPPEAGWRPHSVAVVGRMAYVDWGNQIFIYDLENQGTPPVINQFTNDHPYFTVSEHWLVSWEAAGPQSMLTIVDVSDPTQLSTRGSIMAPVNVAENKVRINGDHIEMAHRLGLALYEIPAGMAPPIDRGLAWTVVEGWQLATAGQTAWMQGTDRRYVVNLTSDEVVNVQDRPSNGETGSMPVRDDLLYYSLGAGLGVQVESLADPRDPQPLTLLDPSPGLEGIDVVGDLLAAADGAGLVLYDVDDPANPARRTELALEGATRRVLIADDTAVVTAYREQDSDLAHVIDITDRDQPQLVQSFALEPAAFPAVGYKAYQLVRRADQVHVMLFGYGMTDIPHTATATVDLAVPGSPQLTYVEEDDRFWCFEDVDGFEGPELHATLDLPVAIGDYHVSFRADTVSVYAYQGAADQLERLATWIAPYPVGTLAAAGNKLLIYGNNRIDVLTLTDLAIVGVPDVAASAAVQAVPNPFNPQTEIVFDMPRAGTALVEVYDVRGGQVRRLEADFPAGLARLIWRGDDQNGRALPSGTYLLRVRTPVDLLSGRCQLIR